MASSTERTRELADQAEKALHAKLAEKDFNIRDIDGYITQYRSTCKDVIFLDFGYARTKNVEAKLWDAHGKINARCRKDLARFRDKDGKAKPVELRKMMKHYLDFIKSSQRFYRSYIQSLASQFGGIPELQQVAQKFKSDCQVAAQQPEISSKPRHQALLSCHDTLVRLGDLSRYRETELVTKDRNWGPAIGYYDLAGTIYPASGASHNQLAVIALADGNHFRATYHLYRALTAQEPHPTAKGNLEIEFKKIRVAWGRGELIVGGPAVDGDAGKALLAWFVRLHARCYRGEEFSEHDELESEVLSQLAVDLKERSLDTTLQRFILITVAAEYFAESKPRDGPGPGPGSVEASQAFFFFLRLNVKTFFTLLQVLQPELERFVVEEGNTTLDGPDVGGPERISAVTRRVLPGLRHYSSWLANRSAFLVAQTGDNSLNIQVKEMWKVYANSLTLLAATFPVDSLPSVDYLLPEDEETLGFGPFGTDSARSRYYNGEEIKPRSGDVGVERQHLTTEMLARVRDFLADGVKLALDEGVPIALLKDGNFAYQEDGLPSELLASPAGHQTISSSPSVVAQQLPPLTEHGGINGILPTSNVPATGEAHNNDDGASQSVDPSESASISMSTNMQDMVSSLVDNEPPSQDQPAIAPQFMSSPFQPTPAHSKIDSPLDRTGSLAAAGLGNMNPTHMQRSSSSHHQHTPRPSLPSIYNTPFAPQPQERTSSPVATPTTARRASPQLQRPSSGSMMRDPSSFHYPSMPQDTSLGLHGMAQTAGIGPTTGYGNDGLHIGMVYASGNTHDQSMSMSPYWTQLGLAGDATHGQRRDAGSGRAVGPTPSSDQGGSGG